MKINKKVLIPVFATAMGLSVLGGISGAVAWYQYNSKVTTSFIGTSVADTGVLQIGYKEAGSSNITWGRDFSLLGSKANLVPVTFGKMNTENLKTNVLPNKAYAYPHAGAGEGYEGHSSATTGHSVEGWSEAANEKEYAQFTIYFKAEQTESTGYVQVQRDVYLTDLILKSVDNTKVAEDALRVHFNIENSAQQDGSKNRLFAKSEHKSSDVAEQDTSLKLYGPLNLEVPGDASHQDKYISTLFNDELALYGNHPANDPAKAGEPYEDGEVMSYGNYGEVQETEAFSSVLTSRNSEDGIDTDADKLLFTTPETGYVTVTVTVWLEGWEVLKTGENTSSNIWNPEYSAGTDIQLGMQFDSGIFRGSDLN